MHAELVAGTPSEPVLLGSECSQCGTVSFPRQAACPRCTSTEVLERRLARRGTLWSWTIQRFRPKSPPYTGPEEFEPFGVGYVELPGEVRVEARLTESDPGRLRIGMEMELTLVPDAPFAFKPV
jgi:uncharacterized OB-fold protein